MGIKRCMNDLCGTTSSAEWKTGWTLRSGDLAILCRKCGYAFEQNSFCEELHKDDSGWRSCGTCGKRLHCGCIASLSLIVLLDGCGVKCIGCARNPEPYSSRNGGKCENYRLFTGRENNVGVDNHKDSNGNIQLPTPHNLNTNVSLGLPKQEGVTFPTTEVEPTLLPPTISVDNAETYGAWRPEATWASTLAQIPMGSFLKDKHDVPGNNMQTTDNYESVAHPNLNMSLGISSGNLQFSSVVDEREQRKMSDAFNQGFVSPCLVPTPPKVSFSPAADSTTSMMPQLRLARPPVEGRGRHQLLPRYWPRITDQELQQISGDSNCTIIPLFEKVLSASDAGRIGRLVLPKACAEAYFPPISQAEGLPINILDVKGKEWVFQFRFWPNNNSRMYVLEGVTPCIQSMQLQAGDTVTFSRKDPEGKLVMGFRKASNSSLQNQPVSNGYSGLSVPMKGNTDTHMHALSKQLDSAGRSVNLHNSEKCGEPTEEGLLPSSTMMTERKKGRNIGAKSKRLLIDSQDAQVLRLTWTEVQGLLRPPSNVNPSIVVIEDAEFEEYEEPPVFGKISVFATRSPGVIEQWAQCDSCSKWRRLPADFLLPTKWTCMDNAWDPTRCFCSAPDELNSKELEFLFSLNKESTKKRMTIVNKATQEQDSSGLIAAGSSDNPNEPGTSAVATTTKHPRHRPGCSCIVCIQPPSGKGKHDSTCTCTVCMTVKRRFKTLMMRKKKRQSDQEAEMVLKNSQILNASKEDRKIGDNGDDQNTSAELADCGPSLDLNFHPEREEELRTGASQASLTNRLELTSVPLDSYVKQNPDEQASSAANPGEDAGETEGDRVEECTASQDQSSKPENTSNKQSDTQ